jgi:hypothetical protein
MCSEEVKKGGEFQDYVVELLYRSGFSEGEIYSTGSKGYYEKTIVFPGSIDAVTSPDILILDWASAASLIQFGIECMRRDKLFDINGQKYLT